MKKIVFLMTLLLSHTSALASQDLVVAGLEFESDLYPQTAVTLSLPFGERHDIGLRLGVQGYQAATATGFERQRIEHYALTYGVKAVVVERLLDYRFGFALGQNHASDAVGRSRYAFYEMSQGFGLKQGKVRLSSDIVARFNGLKGDETLTIGGKMVPALNVFPRFGMSFAFE